MSPKLSTLSGEVQESAQLKCVITCLLTICANTTCIMVMISTNIITSLCVSKDDDNGDQCR